MIFEVECRRRITKPPENLEEYLKGVLSNLGFYLEEEIEATDHYYSLRDMWLRLRDYESGGTRKACLQTKKMLHPHYDMGIRVAEEHTMNVYPAGIDKYLKCTHHNLLGKISGKRRIYRNPMSNVEITLDRVFGARKDGEVVNLGHFIEISVDLEGPYNKLRITRAVESIKSLLERLSEYLDTIGAEVEPRTYPEIVFAEKDS